MRNEEIAGAWQLAQTRPGNAGCRSYGSPEVKGGAIGALAVLTARYWNGETAGRGPVGLPIALVAMPPGVLGQEHHIPEVDGWVGGRSRLNWQVVGRSQQPCESRIVGFNERAIATCQHVMSRT